jgi:hypothetical protein
MRVADHGRCDWDAANILGRRAGPIWVSGLSPEQDGAYGTDHIHRDDERDGKLRSRILGAGANL